VTRPPNIIIFNPDQWRGDVMGHLGNPAAMTPNLDRAVEDDCVSFANAFVQATVCTPSRCSFMTGWYPTSLTTAPCTTCCTTTADSRTCCKC
jgi:arylsulfatase A-like enzyme